MTEAFKSANGDIIAYIDADLAIDITLFNEMKKYISEGYDIVIGSKHLKESEVAYSKTRRFLSRSYSYLASILFKEINIKDYQCGFKCFNREIIDKVLPNIQSKGWSWDTEILIKSHLQGFKIKEIPAKVNFVAGRKSTVKVLKDSYSMGTYLIKLFFETKGGIQ